MIWVFIFLLALLTVAPLVLYAWRGGRLRSRQYAAIALHRAQLQELDQELADGRLMAEEHAAAKLEVQRRLLADAALTETVGTPAAARSVLFSPPCWCRAWRCCCICAWAGRIFRRRLPRSRAPQQADAPAEDPRQGRQGR